MGKGMCKFRSPPSKIEYFSENKLFLFVFKTFLCAHFFHFFSIGIVHNLTFSFVVVDLPAKLSFSKKLCSSKKQLYYIILYYSMHNSKNECKSTTSFDMTHLSHHR
jgi:hypothetical protein